MNKIDGKAKTIRELLSGKKYSIDYYQREYNWETKHIEELLSDLSSKFMDSYDSSHDRSEVERYGNYFLGSIITSYKDGKAFLIDGQQRLTTLTILLIFLHNLQKTHPERVKIDDLIFSEKYSKKSFNLDVEERGECMEALFNQHAFDEKDQPASVVNIIARYQNLEELFPAELKSNALPYFIDWLIENVYLVEIATSSDDDAYLIFETMNDRGLRLTQADMLKGFLLANIADEDERQKCNDVWKKQTQRLMELGEEQDEDAIKNWLRSQYAISIRERKKGAVPGDFDKIGTEFHRWVREVRGTIGLDKGSDYAQFIKRNFSFYSQMYFDLWKGWREFSDDKAEVFYITSQFTLHYPMLLAPLSPDDKVDVITKKLRIVASFIDIWLMRRLWNFKSIAYNTMQYSVFTIIKEIRGKSPEELVSILRRRLDAEQETFSHNEKLGLTRQNRQAIHEILARITHHLEVSSGLPSRLQEYIMGTGKKKYEVEHIWANKPERHKDEFPNAEDFLEYRNRIGGLLLLPKSFNASYGDLPYEIKLEHYQSQNLLARSLHPLCYERNPGFLNYLQNCQLPFRSHSKFTKADLDERQKLYLKVAEEIWNPSRLEACLAE